MAVVKNWGYIWQIKCEQNLYLSSGGGGGGGGHDECVAYLQLQAVRTQHTNLWAMQFSILVLDYKFTVNKCNINITRFVEL
jgi:hypothetical protein